jgi:hypothetical protein
VKSHGRRTRVRTTPVRQKPVLIRKHVRSIRGWLPLSNTNVPPTGTDHRVPLSGSAFWTRSVRAVNVGHLPDRDHATMKEVHPDACACYPDR